MPTTSPAQPSRRERRKAETRARLMASARELFATKGVDGTRINEITEAADVGFGSFYNYFDGKDAIVAAVAEQVIVETGQAVEAATRDIADPAEVVAIGHRVVLALGVADASLGWLLVRLEISHDLASNALGPFALRDLERGIQAGRFAVDDPASVLISCGGALLGMVRALLKGHLGDDVEGAASRHATNILRMLGVPGDEAREIARRPLPSHGAVGLGRSA